MCPLCSTCALHAASSVPFALHHQRPLCCISVLCVVHVPCLSYVRPVCYICLPLCGTSVSLRHLCTLCVALAPFGVVYAPIVLHHQCPSCCIHTMPNLHPMHHIYALCIAPFTLYVPFVPCLHPFWYVHTTLCFLLCAQHLFAPLP